MLNEIDRLSFADSDQFDEDSVNSWLSDSEDQINNWRGWKKAYNTFQYTANLNKYVLKPPNLLQQAAKVVAAIQPGFDLTERGVPFPEELIKLVAFYSFPDKEEEIRLYSCLGCGNVDEFTRGENLYKAKAVKECLQIGFHLSAKVLRRQQSHEEAAEIPPVQYDQGYKYAQYGASSSEFNITNTNSENQINKHLGLNHQVICKVGITFDRGRITSCHCSCYQEFVDPAWCCHVVAACLYRIHEAHTVKIRAPISESLSKLSKEDLQKFSQFLISKMTPADILPAAQNILDALLASTNNPLKSIRGAPDLTAGASSEDNPNWYFDHAVIQENISKILQKFCVPKPVVYGDPRHLSNNLPLVAQEYQNILRPMRGKEPEGIWNLLSIIRDMFRREDSNALSLLRILSNCLLESKPIIMWWYCIKLNQEWCLKGNNQSNNTLHSQYASSYFCDEMVELWRIAALRYCLNSCTFLKPRRLQYQASTGAQISNNGHSSNHHHKRGCSVRELALEIANLHCAVIRVAIQNGSSSISGNRNAQSSLLMGEEAQRQFLGFKPALEACKIAMELQKDSVLSKLSNPYESLNSVVSRGDLSDCLMMHQDSLYTNGAVPESDYTDESLLDQTHKLRFDSELLESDVRIMSTNNLFNTAKQFKKSDLKFAQCESLFYHGYPNESAQLAHELSEHMLEKKTQIFDCMYREARTSLIESHQKLNELNSINNTNSNGSYYNVAGSGKAFNSYKSSSRRYHRGGNNLNSTGGGYQQLSNNCGQGLLNLHYGSGNQNRSPDQMIDAEQNYQAKTFIKKIQFLINCLVNDQVDFSKIPQMHRIFLPQKYRLIEMAFYLLITALQLPRPPAPYKHLEVCIIQLEIDLLIQAQQIQWCDYIVDFRDQLVKIASQLKNKSLPYLTEVYIPYNLGSFVFEQLTGIGGTSSAADVGATGVGGGSTKMRQRIYFRDRTKSRLSQTESMDTNLSNDDNGGGIVGTFVSSMSSSEFNSHCNNVAFESALSVLSMKTKITEQINPLLVEGQRRLRDEFAAFLLNVHKDDIDKLTLIMKQLLDPSLNPHFKAAPLNFYLTNGLNKMLEPLENQDASDINCGIMNNNEEFYNSNKNAYSLIGNDNVALSSSSPSAATAAKVSSTTTVPTSLVVNSGRASVVNSSTKACSNNDNNSSNDNNNKNAVDGSGHQNIVTSGGGGGKFQANYSSLAKSNSNQNNEISSNSSKSCGGGGVGTAAAVSSTSVKELDDAAINYSVDNEFENGKVTIETATTNATTNATTTTTTPTTTTTTTSTNTTVTETVNNNNNISNGVDISDDKDNKDNNNSNNNCDKSADNNDVASCTVNNNNNLAIVGNNSKVKMYSTQGKYLKSARMDKVSSSIDTDSSALEDDTSEASGSERKQWEQKLRCLTTNNKRITTTSCPHSSGMAAIDSSAPETTESSDNSPTTIRKRILHPLNSPTAATITAAPISVPTTNEEDIPSGNNNDNIKVQENCSLPSVSDQNQLNIDSALYSLSLNGQPCGGEDKAGNSLPVDSQTEIEKNEVGGQLDDTANSNDISGREMLTSLSRSSSSSSQILLSLSPSPPVHKDLLNNSGKIVSEIQLTSNQSESKVAAVEDNSMKQQVTNVNESFKDQVINVTEIVTESLAHHMFELAQTVLQKAGIPDDSSTPVFRVTNPVNYGHQQSGQQPMSSVSSQRHLQLCAFQLGVYALGLYNQLNPLWQSRTYSSHVAWISTQLVESGGGAGASAACVLLHSWRHHLTPSEVADTAFRVSSQRRYRDGASMGRVGAELCLAVLAESSALNPSQILRGLRQCSDQSTEMLERGLLSVERGANNSLSGVQPVIYFHLAHAWFELYKNTSTTSAAAAAVGTTNSNTIANNIASTNTVTNNINVPYTNGTAASFVTAAGAAVPPGVSFNLSTNAAATNNYPPYSQMKLPLSTTASISVTSNNSSLHSSPEMISSSSASSPTSMYQQQQQQQQQYMQHPVVATPAPAGVAPAAAAASQITVMTPTIQPMRTNHHHMMRNHALLTATGGPHQQQAPTLSSIGPSGFIQPVSYSTLPHHSANNLNQATWMYGNFILPPHGGLNPHQSVPIPQNNRLVPISTHQTHSNPLTTMMQFRAQYPPSYSSQILSNAPFPLVCYSNTPLQNPLPVSSMNSMPVHFSTNTQQQHQQLHHQHHQHHQHHYHQHQQQQQQQQQQHQQMASSPVQSTNDISRAHEYLLRSFNSAMRAIHILFQPQNSSVAANSVGSGSNDNPNDNSISNNVNSGRRHLVLSSNNSFSTVASALDGSAGMTNSNSSISLSNSDSNQQSHDSNIRWTLKVAKLLGPEEVNRYCMVVLQFIQSPTLMKEIVLEVIEFLNLLLPNLSPNILSNAGAAAAAAAANSSNNPGGIGIAAALDYHGRNIYTSQLSPFAVHQHQTQHLYRHSVIPYPMSSAGAGTVTNNPNGPLMTVAAVAAAAALTNSNQQANMNNSNNAGSAGGLGVAGTQAAAVASSSVAAPGGGGGGGSGIYPVVTSGPIPNTNPVHYTGVANNGSAGGIQCNMQVPAGIAAAMSGASHHHSHLPLPINPLQTGLELISKMINRLHYLFRRTIDRRLQQTGQGVRDWDSLVELILEAYRAQRQLPASDSNLSWVEILQKIKSNRKCTKDLWARICTALQTAEQID